MSSTAFSQKKKSVWSEYDYGNWSQHWLKKRIPPASQHTLHRKNIFIFPSKAGFGFLLTLFLLWLLGTNYQNNLILVLAFLLVSLMHTCIFYTYGNFSGLSVEVKSTSTDFTGDGFVDDFARVTLLLKSQQRPYHNIVLHWPGAEPVTVSLKVNETKAVTMLLSLKKRGWFIPPRLTVSSQYPLGLLRVWTHLDMATRILVYPKPVTTSLPDKQWVAVDDSNDQQNTVSQTTLDMADDISHLREYQQGDSPRYIAWKAYAKGQGLATKVYESVTQAEQQQWLDWNDFSGFGSEMRLSKLCDCVLQAEERGYLYGLRLPGITVPLRNGSAHKNSLLRELALFGGYENKDDKEKERKSA